MCSGVWCVAVPLCWAGPGQSGVCVCECVSVGVFCSSLVRPSSLFLLSLKSNGVCRENARVSCDTWAS